MKADIRHMTRAEQLEYIIAFMEDDIPKQQALLNAYKEELLAIQRQEAKTLKLEKRK